MPTQTLKNNRSRKYIKKLPGSKVPVATVANHTRKIIYKLPINLLNPNELLKAKQKNKVNTKRRHNKQKENNTYNITSFLLSLSKKKKKKSKKHGNI